MGSLRWAPHQYDWYPYKKKRLGYAQRERERERERRVGKITERHNQKADIWKQRKNPSMLIP